LGLASILFVDFLHLSQHAVLSFGFKSRMGTAGSQIWNSNAKEGLCVLLSRGCALLYVVCFARLRSDGLLQR
jgi:hypothetical protein